MVGANQALFNAKLVFLLSKPYSNKCPIRDNTSCLISFPFFAIRSRMSVGTCSNGGIFIRSTVYCSKKKNVRILNNSLYLYVFNSIMRVSFIIRNWKLECYLRCMFASKLFEIVWIYWCRSCELILMMMFN